MFRCIKKKRSNKIEQDLLDTVKETANYPHEKNGKILVCDDASGNRYVLVKYMQRKNCLVDEAINGLDAIKKIEENGQYDIIWMDIQMPKMDGLECTRILREKYNYDGVIIGITGYVDPDSFNRCIQAGMTHVIGKPIDKEILFMYVDKYCFTAKT